MADREEKAARTETKTRLMTGDIDRIIAKQKILIIAGPNGAGKTTFARQFLPNEADCPIFVNADLIAGYCAVLARECGNSSGTDDVGRDR